MPAARRSATVAAVAGVVLALAWLSWSPASAPMHPAGGSAPRAASSSHRAGERLDDAVRASVVRDAPDRPARLRPVLLGLAVALGLLVVLVGARPVDRVERRRRLPAVPAAVGGRAPPTLLA